MVGLSQTVSAQAAHAPKMEFEAQPRLYAKMLVISRWNSDSQYECLDKLWTQESHWNPKARNKSSGAYGIAQFMPTTWGNYKVKKTSSAMKQVDYGLHYIKVRYGSACKAWAHEKKYGWY